MHLGINKIKEGKTMTEKKEADKAKDIFEMLELKSPDEFYIMPIYGKTVETERDFLDHCCSVKMKLAQPAAED